jgi:ABC-type polysaccharide/polyol phosphate transport system ATPase subunit
VTGPSGPAPAIDLQGVGKRYDLLRDSAMLLRAVLPFRRPDRREHWAVRDVDLTIAPGETVGILGRNGAGKTTLLRMLAGVSRPTEGQVTIRGRVAPLIGVGVGFHPEMTGRENVYVNGMLLGLSKAEVDARFDAIVDFAELAEFVDSPVKFYSSGMFMRLGFAVAVHTDPRIFLVDEVLAVGDIAFQLKCFERMRALQASGTTIILVSHSMHAIRLLCPRAVLLSHGRVELDGPAESVIARHHELLSEESGSAGGPGLVGGAVRVVERSLHRAGGGDAHAVGQGDDLVARFRLRFETDVESPHLFFRILSEDGQLAYSMQTTIGQLHRRFRAGEESSIEVAFTPRLGGGGTYRTSLVVTDTSGMASLAADDGGLLFYVTPRLGVIGPADLDAAIRVDGTVLSDHAPLLFDDEA